ncbi:MAG: tyrosine-type recombinase/integrase [Bacteroidales bacterium]|nr:tyrosine-type recombinase/integrase [Bacteroidales bacterium]
MMKLNEAWNMYATDKRLFGYQPGTIKAYKLQLDLLIRHSGDMKMADVTHQGLKQYLASLTHLKPGTVGYRIKFIRSYFRWAHEEGLISNNPAAKIKEPKMGLRIPKALPEKDIEMLREACETPKEHAIIEFIYTTGCRIGEVVKLNTGDINWQNRSCIVMGKGSKEREVYFNVKCSIWLEAYVMNRRDKEPALFATQRAPHRMSISRMRDIVKSIAKRAGIQTNVYPHKLRHSYATHLLDNGMPLEGIQSMLGHSKLETTRLYAQLSGQRRREMYQRYF